MIMEGSCGHCDKHVKLVLCIPYCKYISNGLASEVKNHPTAEDGTITCEDGVCEPGENVYDEDMVDELDLSKYEDYYYRCDDCDCHADWEDSPREPLQ